MIAIDPPVRILFEALEPKGPSTHGFRIDVTDTVGQSNTDSNTTVTNTATAVALAIRGTAGGQPVSDQGTILPFGNVTISDANVGQTDTATVTLIPAGNGTLSNLGAGTYNAQTGTYSVTGPATAVTFALRGWIFTPTAHQVAPGQAVTTTFAITDTNTASQSVTDGSTSVIATAGTLAPTIGLLPSSLSITDTGTVAPFASAQIGDLNVGQTETLTVNVPAANGTLTDIILGGTYDPVGGTYTFIGLPAAVTAALKALVFTPTPHQVAPGQSITTTFTSSTSTPPGPRRATVRRPS